MVKRKYMNQEPQIKSPLPEREEVDFIKYYVKPHTKVARDVTKEDIVAVMQDAHILYNLCYSQHGYHPGAYAVAHPQINDKDPLRFFVTRDKEIIINPVIIRHTNHTIDSEEGCLSFPYKGTAVVQRWNKCEVECQTLDAEGEDLTEKVVLKLSGLMSKIFQHEIDHFDGKMIFDINN